MASRALDQQRTPISGPVRCVLSYDRFLNLGTSRCIRATASSNASGATAQLLALFRHLSTMQSP